MNNNIENLNTNLDNSFVEPKKKGNKLIFPFILVLLLLLGAVGFILYDKGIILNDKKEEVKEEKKEEAKEESVTFSDSELVKYVNYINPASIGPSKLLYGINNVKASELSAKEKIEYIGGNIYEKQQLLNQNQYLNEGKGKFDAYILETDVKELVEKVYGANTYEKTVFNLGCGDYTIDESNGKYYTKTGCGGAALISVENVIIDYKATKSKLEITTAYAFSTPDGIYKDFDAKEKLDEPIDDTLSYGEHSKRLIDYIKENEEKLSHIVYTFESTDGRNYYFKEFTNNK